MDPARIVEAFPAPEFRGAQERALQDVRRAFEAGNRVVLVRAPTGSGKSLLARAIAGAARRPGDAGPEQPVGAYYTTPQVSQIDDVAADPLLEDVAIIRGKGNYDCILPGETDTPVPQAPCERERQFDCQLEHRCPYFSDRSIAANRHVAGMTLAYFMQTAGSDVFGPRDVVVIDEAHGLGDWAEMYATVALGPDTVPVWDAKPAPNLGDAGDAADYAQGLETVLERRLKELRNQEELAPADAAERDQINRLRRDLSWFCEDHADPESGTTWVVDQADDEGSPVRIKPLAPERYLGHTVWDRGERFALLSATILEKDAFCASVGLSPDDVALVDVPHTFPVEHRPLYDVTCGKMTYEHRDQTLPRLAERIVQVMAAHPEEAGIVHCHSYAIAETLADLLADRGVGDRIRTHGRDDRDASLSTWLDADAPTAFLSVKMEEALDLADDLARWQVLCKAPYPNTNDTRVAARLEEGQWGWYYRTALKTVIQACGRVVRSPEDYGATYVADDSLLDLFDRARSAMPDWFAAQVDRMAVPDLPDAGPDAALAGLDDATAPRRSRRGGSSGRRSADGTGATGESNATGESGASGESGVTGGSEATDDSGVNHDRSTGGGRSERRNPVADVWDTE